MIIEYNVRVAYTPGLLLEISKVDPDILDTKIFELESFISEYLIEGTNLEYVTINLLMKNGVWVYMDYDIYNTDSLGFRAIENSQFYNGSDTIFGTSTVDQTKIDRMFHPELIRLIYDDYKKMKLSKFLEI